MPRRPRSSLDDYEFFHVTTRGVGETRIFVDELDRLFFTDCFWTAVLAFDLKCLVSCQVGTHYHAVFQSKREALSNAMRKLNGAYARGFNERHGRRGHLFGGRFSSWVFESESHFAATIPYILQNPVRAGLCALPEQWEWSWLSRELVTAVDSVRLAEATGSDSPMGQSLRRARERQARARLREAGGQGREGRGRRGDRATASRTSFRSV